ncbi:MAG: hypothetical protein GY772_21310, partial [bacterium]|nr:hypothetical protein [bacterium]
MRDQVVAASGRGDRAFRWMLEAELPSVDITSLANPGRKFRSLDCKLKAAVSAIATKEIARQILQASEEEAEEQRTLKGRQALWIVYRHYDINEDAGVVYDFTDLLSVKCLGDDSMQLFLDQWTMVLSSLREQPTVETREYLFAQQLRQSTVLRDQMYYYDCIGKKHDDHCYEFLLKQVRVFIERKRHMRNREDWVRALQGKAIRG